MCRRGSRRAGIGMIAIGIDPGKSGALAVLHDDYIKAQVFDIQEYSKIPLSA